ncbi:MAG: ATP-binding protein [Actinomycetota bacterium]
MGTINQDANTPGRPRRFVGPAAGEAGLARSVPADQDEIRPLRAEIGEWLEGIGADDAARDGVVLCVWEALTNAVEHGSLAGDKVDLSLTASRDGSLVAEVGDQGRLLERKPEPHRGHGMVLMRSLMNDVELGNDDLGTTVHMRMLPKTTDVA